MKLDRNLNPNGQGKYALIKMREVVTPFESVVRHGEDFTIIPTTAIDHGDTEGTDFFVIRLKDKYAAPALAAYAKAAMKDDEEYGAEIAELAKTALDYPHKRIPD